MPLYAAAMLLAAYGTLVMLLSVQGAHRLLLTGVYWRSRNQNRQVMPLTGDDLPSVTVQLPVFNEPAVVAAAVDALASLDWPRNKLQIQVLDDSTDNTLACAWPAIERAQHRGVVVEVLHRQSRLGFKAGALSEGLRQATGELVAIFDADFVPAPDFLRKMVPHFSDPGVGMVQARWGHRNEAYSWLTQAQGLLLDGHFVIEHTARHRGGVWFHFNGTAGIWRKRCIEEGGGWQQDTLTEDMDLSYRAQLAGWRFVYCLEEVVPAELPVSLSALRTQQARWARGSVQVLKKLYRRILWAPYPIQTRMGALAHMGANLAWPLGLLVAMILPLLVHEPQADWLKMLYLPAFFMSTGANVVFYLAARPQPAAVPRVVLVILLGIGLSVGQSVAVLQGLWAGTGEFVRTQKMGGKPEFYKARLSWFTWIELLLAGWSGWGLYQAGLHGYWSTVPFLTLFLLGFGWVGLMGVLASVQSRPTSEVAPCAAGEQHV